MGHWSALNVPGWFGYEETGTAGAMATVAGGVFGVTMLVAPREGLIWKGYHRARLRWRILVEDVLGLLYRHEESVSAGGLGAGSGMMNVSTLRETLGVGGVAVRAALMRLRSGGQIRGEGGAMRLTDAGRAQAANVVRSHRLWETYLRKHTPLPMDHLHAPAEQLEHITDPGMQRRLADATGRVDIDPQGKPVPPAG